VDGAVLGRQQAGLAWIGEECGRLARAHENDLAEPAQLVLRLVDRIAQAAAAVPPYTASSHLLGIFADFPIPKHGRHPAISHVVLSSTVALWVAKGGGLATAPWRQGMIVPSSISPAMPPATSSERSAPFAAQEGELYTHRPPSSDVVESGPATAAAAFWTSLARILSTRRRTRRSLAT
jgi:hypothetical protein